MMLGFSRHALPFVVRELQMCILLFVGTNCDMQNIGQADLYIFPFDSRVVLNVEGWKCQLSVKNMHALLY